MMATSLPDLPIDHFQCVLSCSATTHNVYATSGLILCELGHKQSSTDLDSHLKENDSASPCLKPGTLSMPVAVDSKASEVNVEGRKSVSILIDSDNTQGCPRPPHDPCEVAELYLKLRDLRVKNELALEQGLDMTLAQVGLK